MWIITRKTWPGTRRFVWQLNEDVQPFSDFCSSVVQTLMEYPSGHNVTRGFNLATKQDGKNPDYTALHAWASRSYAWSNCEESMETASILLVAGCDLNSKDGDGRTPLFDIACFSDTKLLWPPSLYLLGMA